MSAGIGFFVIGGSAISIGAIALGYQQIDKLNMVRALKVPAGAVIAVIAPEYAAVRYRDDGPDPTQDAGMPIAAGNTVIYSQALSAIRFIEQAPNAKLNVLYYAGASS